MEPTLKYHPGMFEVLTRVHHLDREQCMVGSLTGAVSSQSVTEELEGTLVTVRSEEHTSELQSPDHIVCRLLLEKKKTCEYILRSIGLHIDLHCRPVNLLGS